ncbi:MAG: hypothetical protein H6835_07175 [Planctomycetes bacterium]|nr:hypothetical protein [Planctomycetota bacterium]
MNALMPLLLCLLQDPRPAEQAPTPRTAGRLDVVELKNGDQLTGRVTSELDGYVEIEVEHGAVIGVSRAMVAAVRRAAVDAPKFAAKVAADDAWFVLHDADGEAVGWLHTVVTTRGDGGFAVNEEYEFTSGQRRYQITNLCAADADGRGESCYFRERISEPMLAAQHGSADDPMAASERVVDERIVEAQCQPGRLVVKHLDGTSRDERELPWSDEATFPLLARTLARQSSIEIGPVTMFDPANEELAVGHFDGTGARHVLIDGERRSVGELAETTAAGQNREWVDAGMKTVRRELAGPSLVAVPSNAASARHAVGVATIPSAVVAEADGRFGLWLPNPTWQVEAPLPAGHVLLRCPANDAEVRLSLLDHLEPGTPLDTAVDAVQRWFALLHPELKVECRVPGRVRDRVTVRLEAATPSGPRATRAAIDVIPDGETFLVLICLAPRSAWDELADDFAFVRRAVELQPEALSPKLQGPLDARTTLRRSGRGPLPIGVPKPGPAERVPTSDAVPNVRIPSEPKHD